jgi:hypothetical protein
MSFPGTKKSCLSRQPMNSLFFNLEGKWQGEAGVIISINRWEKTGCKGMKCV